MTNDELLEILLINIIFSEMTFKFIIFDLILEFFR